VIREDIGTGRDHASAATAAFKRAAARFGVAREVYDRRGEIWLQMDGRGRGATPLESPRTAWARERAVARGTPDAPVPNESSGASNGPAPDAPALPQCPECGGRMWDNRATKRNAQAPDYRCRARSCDGAIWPAAPAGR
jgi:hypothetical protein